MFSKIWQRRRLLCLLSYVTHSGQSNVIVLANRVHTGHQIEAAKWSLDVVAIQSPSDNSFSSQ